MNISIKERSFPSATGLCDTVYRFYLPQEVRGAVVVVHGMAEHQLRYETLCRYLAGNGFAVATMDLPSHGKSRREGLPVGFFGREKGFDKVLEDIRHLIRLLRSEYPSTGLILYGHSMGSILTALFMSRFGEECDGYLLSGTTGPNPAAKIGRLIAKWQIQRGKGEQPSQLLDKLAFGGFNKKFRNPKTPFDWLSRDEKAVQAYIDDPLCGFAFTPYGYDEVFAATGQIASASWANRVPKRPIMLLSGDRDPVGQMGKGVKKVYQLLKQTGHSQVELKLYTNGRHEMHNELNRSEVWLDMLLFLETVLIQGEDMRP